MRKIEFRIFHPLKKKLVYKPEALHELTYHNTDNGFGMGVWCKGDFHDCALMQFIGLTDKFGKKIFEGDIIKMGGGGIVAVEFKDGGFGYQGYFMSNEFIGFAGHHNFDRIMPHIEIIGNIYENPELLNQ